MLKKTNRISLVEQVALQIEEQISAGYWKVGEKLPPELELMETFAVSRNTVREAIRALVYAGLLETRQGSGTVVRSNNSFATALQKYFKKSNIIETLEVRAGLEREAARLAAMRRTQEDLADIQACIEKCLDAAKSNDNKRFAEADLQFHKRIVKAAGNKVLSDLYEHLNELIYHSIDDFITSTELSDIKFVHHDLFEAIRKKDMAGAAASVESYIDSFKKRLEDLSEG
ncbi:FadR/GntR family transcriptional regulator [Siminovitchia sediminis]|uniref:FadR/GntR family transcriptional regulator n=1 Tax=Siminovitchia sediminis TaxID=1274353 RepID=A0ABW4KLS4_9BACI